LTPSRRFTQSPGRWFTGAVDRPPTVILAAMEGIVQRPLEGEELFGGRILLKSTLPDLCITESFFQGARDGADLEARVRRVRALGDSDGLLVQLAAHPNTWKMTRTDSAPRTPP